MNELGVILECTEFEQYLNNQHKAMNTKIMYIKILKDFLCFADDKKLPLDDSNTFNKFLLSNGKDGHSKPFSYIYGGALRKYITFKYGRTEKGFELKEQLIKLDDTKPPVTNSVLINDNMINSLLEYVKEDKHKLLLKLQLATGARASDLLRLKFTGIYPITENNEEYIRLEVENSKGNKRKTMFIFDKGLALEFINYVKTINQTLNLFVFINMERKPYRMVTTTISTEDRNESHEYDTYLKSLKFACINAKVPDIATHDFRRYAAMKLYNKTKDLLLLQRQLNHSDIKTTTRYLEGMGILIKDSTKILQNNFLKNNTQTQGVLSDAFQELKDIRNKEPDKLNYLTVTDKQIEQHNNWKSNNSVLKTIEKKSITSKQMIKLLVGAYDDNDVYIDEGTVVSKDMLFPNTDMITLNEYVEQKLIQFV